MKTIFLRISCVVLCLSFKRSIPKNPPTTIYILPYIIYLGYIYQKNFFPFSPFHRRKRCHQEQQKDEKIRKKLQLVGERQGLKCRQLYKKV